MNREKAIRLAAYSALTGTNIEYDEGLISVWDEKAEDTTNNIYILFRDQGADIDNNFCRKSWNCTLELAIVNKQPDTISKDTTDDIAEQVEQLLESAFSSGIESNGWQYNNFVLSSTNYSGLILTENSTEIEKTLIFTFTSTKI